MRSRWVNRILWLLPVLFLVPGSVVYANAAVGETSEVTALEVTGDKPAGETLQLASAVPGDSGRHRWFLKNDGNSSGRLNIAFSAVRNFPGNGGGEFEGGDGEFGASAEMAVYVDADGSGDWSDDDVGLKSDGTVYGYPMSLEYGAMDEYSRQSWSTTALVPTSETYQFVLLWRIPVTAGNDIQGDEVSFDITFILIPAEAYSESGM